MNFCSQTDNTFDIHVLKGGVCRKAEGQIAEGHFNQGCCVHRGHSTKREVKEKHIFCIKVKKNFPYPLYKGIKD